MHKNSIYKTAQVTLCCCCVLGAVLGLSCLFFSCSPTRPGPQLRPQRLCLRAIPANFTITSNPSHMLPCKCGHYKLVPSIKVEVVQKQSRFLASFSPKKLPNSVRSLHQVCNKLCSTRLLGNLVLFFLGWGEFGLEVPLFMFCCMFVGSTKQRRIGCGLRRLVIIYMVA